LFEFEDFGHSPGIEENLTFGIGQKGRDFNALIQISSFERNGFRKTANGPK
jgi:hypothetical protein